MRLQCCKYFGGTYLGKIRPHELPDGFTCAGQSKCYIDEVDCNQEKERYDGLTDAFDTVFETTPYHKHSSPEYRQADGKLQWRIG